MTEVVDALGEVSDANVREVAADGVRVAEVCAPVQLRLLSFRGSRDAKVAVVVGVDLLQLRVDFLNGALQSQIGTVREGPDKPGRRDDVAGNGDVLLLLSRDGSRTGEGREGKGEDGELHDEWKRYRLKD